ncbi:hypothetical protein HN747_03400 [archaeon]|jgi:hypothetical protein|nr:hypothetical protein [archaeon]
MKFEGITLEKELELMREKPTPYFYEITNGTKKIVIFGLEHTRNVEHPQFNELSKIITKLDPELVLFEFGNELDNLIKEDREISIKKIGEIKIISDLLRKDVEKLGVDIHLQDTPVSPEISEETIFILKLLNRTRSICSKNDVSVIDFISGELARSKKEDLKNKIISYLEELTGEKIDSITKLERMFPTPIDNINLLNDAVRHITRIRDDNMVNKLFEAVKKKDRILFPVGRNHALRWEKFLKNNLISERGSVEDIRKDG